MRTVSVLAYLRPRPRSRGVNPFRPGLKQEDGESGGRANKRERAACFSRMRIPIPSRRKFWKRAEEEEEEEEERKKHAGRKKEARGGGVEEQRDPSWVGRCKNRITKQLGEGDSNFLPSPFEKKKKKNRLKKENRGIMKMDEMPIT